MKIVHLSDIHINPGEFEGINPLAHFNQALAHIEKYHHDADKVIISGDLTHYGDEESYKLLKQALEKTTLTGNAKPRLMIGNHDKRDVFAKHFPEVSRDPNGFIQYSETTPKGVFIYMDTVLDGDHRGEYCALRQAWLIDELKKARENGQSAWLFMHHNPVRVHIANADKINIINEPDLHEILAANRDIIRHMFFGHCHYTLSGSVLGIPFSAPRSTSHPCWPEFSGDPSKAGYGPLERNYNVCFLGENDTIIHTIDFEKEDQVIWYDE